ncbi:MAG: hypothetical protein WBA02_03685 [Jannaschia helgolandensis]|uniref:hypothetical protein n=1 Tax=Jannaschia helgolandensis TaxID=188906 RepID=UPI000B876E16|nr:hypothetical protein [Jannaschia helgolandensis]
MTKRLVLTSIEDTGGDRCVDILCMGEDYGWVECRRDPEDAHGWRHLHPPRMGFADAAAARAEAGRSVGWLGRC